MRRILFSLIGLSGMLACWACSSSSSDDSSATNPSNDGGPGSDASTFDGGPTPAKDASGPPLTNPDGGPGSPFTWGTLAGSSDSMCAIVGDHLDCMHNSDPSAVMVPGATNLAHVVTRGKGQVFLDDGGIAPASIAYCGLDLSGVITCDDGAEGTASITNVTQMANGQEGHACALNASGQVFCWGGGNFHGDLGTGDETATDGPVTVSLPSKAVSITASDHISCAALDTGDVDCWGLSTYRPAAGVGPAKVDFGGGKVVSVVASIDNGDLLCGILDDGTVRCIGDVTVWSNAASFDIAHLAGAKRILNDFAAACGLFADGSVKCIDNQAMPNDPALPEPMIEIAPSDVGFLARSISGAVYTFLPDGVNPPTKQTFP